MQSKKIASKSVNSQTNVAEILEVSSIVRLDEQTTLINWSNGVTETYWTPKLPPAEHDLNSCPCDTCVRKQIKLTLKMLGNTCKNGECD